MFQPTTIKQILNTAAHELDRLDAEVLLGHALSRPRSYLHAWPERELTPEQQSQFMDLLRRRMTGEPVAYITGQQEFWSLPFEVNPATLIPRPETELLVETTLQLATRIDTGDFPMQLADLGTGSGCIALALAHERPHWRITAVDISKAALQTAQRNAQQLGIDTVDFLHNEWLSGFSASAFDIIVANPPYIRADDPHLRSIAHEPQSALVAGEDGVNDLRNIIAKGHACLKPNGLLLLEIGHDQSAAVDELMQAAGYTDIEFKYDLSGIPRVCVGWRS